jgi:hypothetical protein
MKTLSLCIAILCLTTFIGCKKSDGNSDASKDDQIKVSISGVPANTTALVTLTNFTPFAPGTSVNTKSDTTFYVYGVTKGLHITGRYNFTHYPKPNKPESGSGTVKIYYKDESRFTASNGTGNITIDIP